MSATLTYKYKSIIYKYQIYGSGDNKYISITGCDFDSPGEELFFPEEIDGIPVTQIAKNAFESTTFKSAYFHKNIDFIDEFAFYDSCLEKVEFSEGLKEIGHFAFGDTILRSVTLPDSLKIIHGDAFSSSPLSSITFGKNLEVIEEDAFSFCDFESFSIPDSVKVVEDDILFNNSRLKSLHIGKQAKITNNITFCCKNLEKISIDPLNPYNAVADDVLYTKDMSILVRYPSGKKDKAFKIPKSVKRLEYDSFSFCDNLKDVYIYNDSILGLHDSSIDTCSLVVHCRPKTLVSEYCSLNGIPMWPLANSKINGFIESLDDDNPKEVNSLEE